MTDLGKPSTLPSSLLGIVTVTYNSAKYLDAFFRSCEQQTHKDYIVYAIDNASSDDTARRLRERAIVDPRTKVTINAKNGGVAAGNNRGIVQAVADGCVWILLLNNDTEFPPEMIERLLSACVANSWRVCVPKIHYDTPKDHIWYGGGGFCAHKGYTGYHVGMNQLDNAQCDVPGTVEYSPTCAMLVHRSVFFEIGLMDEAYFVYCDDTDFCWRLRQHSIPIGYWPKAMLVHKVGGSTGGVGSPFTARFTSRNRLYFLKKHFGSLHPLLWLPVFLPYYVGRYLLFSWRPTLLMASFKGSFEYGAVVPHQPTLEHVPFIYRAQSVRQL